MIKLSEILQEVYVEKPPKDIEGAEELIQKGFKMGEPEIDPATGKISTSVTYLPKFKQMRIELIQKRNEIKPFKFSANEDIAKVATEADKMIGKLSQLIFALDKMIELQQKGK
jgi:hypothetical protein